MFTLLIRISAPLISLLLFALSNGFLSTLLAVRLHNDGYGSLTIGLLSTAYYAGLICGAFRSEKLIYRIGHIRAFATFSSFIAVLALVQGMWVNPFFWLILRLIVGAATAGLFVVIESWLLTISATSSRGRILAIYMVVLYLGHSVGQLILNVGDSGDLSLFAITAMLTSLAIIPLAITSAECPRCESISTLKLPQLYRLSASGSIGCFCAGLMLGAIYGLLPIYLIQTLHQEQWLSWLMATTIFGGMCLQYPLGRLSDTIERRKIIIAIAAVIALCCTVLIITPMQLSLVALLLFLIGGATFVVYPISISHACDSIETHDITAATQGLLIFYGLGAVLGPLLAATTMHYLSFKGLPIFLAAVSTALAGFFVWRKTQTARATQEEHFIPMPQTTPILAEIDPRGENDIDTSLTECQ